MKLLFLYLALLLTVAVPGVASAEPATGSVKGRIDCQADSACLGVAALWRAEENLVPAPDRYVLVPAVVSALEEDGSFELVAPVGDYYVGGQVRKSGGPLFGSPQVGDKLYLIKEQDVDGYRVTVAEGQVVDVGVHSANWTYAGLNDSTSMGISGQVLDVNQQPVAGLLVFAFADPGANTTPLAVSVRTGEDGRFVLPLAKPGPVFLRAREKYRGGQPQADDYISVAAVGASQPVVVTPAQVTTEVKVLVRRLPSVLEMKNAPDSARPKID